MSLELEFTDTASGIRGWAGAGVPGGAEGETAVLLFEGAEVLVAERSSDASLSANGDGQLAAAFDPAAIEVKVTAAARTEPLRGGRATVELTRKGKKRSFECPGAFGGLAPADPDAELVRTVVALQADGSALALRSSRPGAASGHGEEQTEAWLLDADATEARPIDEPLLSTQYDEGGDQMRAGLELWVGAEDQMPLRGAGTRVCGTRMQLGDWSLRGAFFAWTIEGVNGSGSYMLWQR